jgi:hypothetical protein
MKISCLRVFNRAIETPSGTLFKTLITNSEYIESESENLKILNGIECANVNLKNQPNT